MRKKEKNKENYINSLIEEEQIRLEVTQQALEVRLQVLQQALQEIQKEGINPVYVIIGCLQEYSGGYSLDDRTVDIFFVNESENAQLFKSLCDYYLTTINEKSDVELIQAENGNYYINSEKICAAFNYTLQIETLTGVAISVLNFLKMMIYLKHISSYILMIMNFLT